MHRVVLTIAMGISTRVHADTDSWPYQPGGETVLDAGLVAAAPAALATGLGTGVGAGVARGRTFVYGARAAWTAATESTMAWQVTHDDVRLRAIGGVQHAAGRGTFGLRVGAGGTLVHESRLRVQGARAGLTGDDLATTAWRMLPAADLEATVHVHVAGPWLLALSGGPSVAVVDGSARASWSAQLGVAWQP